MRIYYMEERMQQRYGDGQDVFRTNIELQVDIENLKRELADKQVLVQKAALAMETLTAKHEQEEQLMRNRLRGDCQEEMNQLRHQLELANQKCVTSYKDVEKAEKRLEMLNVHLDDVQMELTDSRRVNEELTVKVKNTESEVQTLSGQLTLADQVKTKCEKENLALIQKVKDLEEQLQDALKGFARKDRDLLDELDDQKAAIAKKDGKIAELEEKLKTKDTKIGDLEAAVKYLENKYKDTEEALGHLEKEAERKDTQLGRYKKSIEGLVKSLQMKDEECKEQKKQLAATREEVSHLQDALKEAELQKAQALDNIASQLVEAQTNCERLLHQLTEANETSENLVKSLGKKEGELAGFQERLSTAIDALTKSEEAVEALQAQLRGERADFDNRLKEQAVHFQISVNNKSEHGGELEGLRQQIVDLQKLIASQNVELLGLTRDRDVVGDLQDRLKEKGAEIELMSTEHKRELFELERELQALRVALTGKDMQIETMEKHTAWLNDHQRETVERMRETLSGLGGVDVQELSHNLLQDIKMLMDLLRQEISSLATLQLPLRDLDQSGHGINTEALSTEILSVQRIYRKLEEGVEKNSRLHQALLNSARGEHRQSDSPDNNSCQDGGYNLGSSQHQAKQASTSASPERRAGVCLSPQQKSAKRGTAAVLSESVSSLESDWGSPPASHSVAVETCPELIDRSLQTGTSFCHTDQWVQTSPMIAVGAAGLSPGDQRLPGAGNEVLSVSIGLSPMCKSRLMFFDSDDDLRRHYVFGHHNDSLTDDAKEEHLGLYAENLEDYQNFQHGVFFDEHHLDSHRYDQGSVLMSSSQQVPSSRTSAASAAAAPILGRSGRDGSVAARSLDRTGNQNPRYSLGNLNPPGYISDLDEPDGSFGTTVSSAKFGHVSPGASDKPSCIVENSDSQMTMTQRNGLLCGSGVSRVSSALLSNRTDDGGSGDGTLSKTDKTLVFSDASLLAPADKSGKDRVDAEGGKNVAEKHEDSNNVQTPEKDGESVDRGMLLWSGKGQSVETAVRDRSRRNSWAEELEKYRVQNSKKVPDQQINHSRNQDSCSLDQAPAGESMSTCDLKNLVKELQADLVVTVTQNQELRKQLEAANSDSHYNYVEFVYLQNRKSRIPRPCGGSSSGHSPHSGYPVNSVAENTQGTESQFGLTLECQNQELHNLPDSHSQLNTVRLDVDRTKSTPNTRAVADDTAGQLSGFHDQVKYLEEKLQASEETVQLLSQKNQEYLSVLGAAGISIQQMNRSNSETCLDAKSAASGGRRTSSSGDLSTWMSTGQQNCQNVKQISLSNSRITCSTTFCPDAVDSIETARSHFPSTYSQSGNDSCYSVPASVVATMSGTQTQSPDSTTRHLEDTLLDPSDSTVRTQNKSSPNFNLPVCFNNLSQKTGPVEVTYTDHTASTDSASALSVSLKINSEASPDLQDDPSSPGRTDQSPPGRTGQSPRSRIGQSSHGYSGQRQAGGQRSPWQGHPKQAIDASVLDCSGFPDVTYSSMLDNTTVNRLLANLDQNMSAIREDSSSVSSLSMEQLQLRVEHLERVSLTLREEIEVYEALHRSQGTQVSPSLGEECAGEGYGQERNGTEEDLLKQHLIEIRKLRQRLERLDVTKDPDQLLIFQSHTQQRIARQETMISHLQQQMVEKEEKWQRDLAEMQHKISREKALLVEKLEVNVADLQKTVKSQVMKIEDQDRQIIDLLTELNMKEEFERKKEDELKKVMSEKSELEVDLLKRDKEFLDIEKKLFRLEMAKENSESECRRLYCEIEERDQENEQMRKQIEEGRESSRCLKETVVKCEKSLQEKVHSLQKLNIEKAASVVRLAEKDGQIKKLEAELGVLRKEVDKMELEIEEKAGLRVEIDRLREELKKKESLEAKYEFQKVGYQSEIERVTEENNQMKAQLEYKNQMRAQLESKIEEAAELRHRIDGLQQELKGKEQLEDHIRSLQEKIRSLEDRIDILNSELDSKTAVEAELRERLNTLCSAQSEVIVLKEKLASAGESVRLVEDAKKKVAEDLREREEKIKKRDKQLHHLLGQYKKLDTAFTKQKYLLSEKLELVQSLKKQMHLYEVTLTCASQEEKDNIMKQLLKELIATQRQVEELLSRLEQNSAAPKITSVFVDGFSMSSSSVTTCTTTTTVGSSHHDLPNLATTTVPTREDTAEKLLDDLNFSDSDLNQELRPYSALTQMSTNHLSPHRSVLSSQSTSPNRSPRPLKYFAGSDCAMPKAGTMPQAMVSSDIRSLFAILKLDSHEKLRKETAECLVVLSGLEARLGSRLKLYKTKTVSESMDYSTLREASMSCQNLRLCLEEAKRLIATAWISELPPIDARGHFYDPVLVEQNEHLKRQLAQLSSHCDVLDHCRKEQPGRSPHTESSSSSNRSWENSLYKQLHKTSKDLEQAKENIDTSVELTSPHRYQSFSHSSPQKPARRRLEDTL
ncbi:unnamed protein product [Candidula unifasciata]|uniref:Centrosomin N-terminal motif 1 domain-containing protein n=1 Tax=Candidula unifasciata TaxID=100452 RepID=A0A8S3ZL99_9EUPU|nr:unnamed protein product [Candidula unifasciata]